MNISDWQHAPFKLEPPGISIKDRMSRNVHSTYETRYLTRDGRIIDVEVRSFPLTLDGRLVLFNSWRDVTERKAAYRALLESEQKLRGLYELSALGIALREFGGNYVDFNEAYRKITGYEVAELVDMDNWMLTPAEWAGLESQQIDSLEKIGRYGPYEKEYIRKDGSRVPVRLSGVMVRGQDGRRYVWSIVEDISESRRIQDEIQGRAAQLRSLLANHEEMLEAERTHIAREVHDELGQTLTSLGFEIGALRLRVGMDDAVLAKIINTMSSLTSHAIHVTRNVAENLRPTAMSMGIVPAIEWLCNRFTAHSGTRYTLLKAGEFDDMGQPQVDALFRIAQESLTNVSRHANARNVTISLARRGNTIELCIADDGAGFEASNSRWPRSFGLLGMRERAAAMGGNVDIQSAPGRGTTVTARIPFEVGKENDAGACIDRG
jgi:PAS domain S-box-containing protein